MTEIHRIERLGHLGDGIAAGPVFVPRTLPGEEVSGDLAEGRIEMPRIIMPSPHRVKAPCRHYNACGGCALMHGSDDFVAGWKTEIVQNALAAHDLAPVFKSVQTSPAYSRRRAVLSARRAKKGAMIGFHARRSSVIAPIEHCHLLHPTIMEALPALADLALIGASRKGELAICATQALAGLDVSVTGGKPLERELETALAQALHRSGFARLTWNTEVIATETPPAQRFGCADVVPPPGAFLQATHEGEAALLAAVRDIIGGARQVVDLFAGCGTFALPLAETSEIHAVEGQADMLDALSAGWRNATGLRKVTVEARDLFRNPLLPDELGRFDAAVIDPPRAGAMAQVAELAASDIKTIAMVSCNPVSFAQDAKTLVEAGFSLNWVQVVDQFRWSSHIEQVASFTR